MPAPVGQESRDIPGSAKAAIGTAANARWLLRQLRLFKPRDAWIMLAMLIAIFAILLLNTIGQVRLNQWQGAFYNALDHRDRTDFVSEIGVFFVIVTILLVLVVGQTWLSETLKVLARRLLTGYLLEAWLTPRRAYLLGFAGEVAKNPDQRISEDASRLTELSIGLAVGLGQSSLLLVSFLGVLWNLSQSVTFFYHGQPFTVPGYMVWCALIFTVIGSLLTSWVGRPMIAINASRYAREGELRSALVRVAENADVIALQRGEEDERAGTVSLLTALTATMQKLANARARLTWVTSGYGWVGIVAPIVVASPAFFTGTMNLGGLIMVVGSFNQVQNALRWFIDNYSNIAEWQAGLQRVTALIDTLQKLEIEHSEAGRIAMLEGPPDRLVLDNLAVCLPGDLSTCIIIEERHLVVRAGERVEFVGPPGSGKTTLFMALAGLWPWGRGTITEPAPFNAMFVPERPFLPPGTLRQSLAYPDEAGTYTKEDVASAMADAGLGHLADQLDVANHWGKDLSLGDQQRLAMARLILRKPGWAILDDCLSALGGPPGRDLLATMVRRLPQTGILSTSNAQAGKGFYSRSIQLGGVASLPPFTLEDGIATRTPVS